MNSEGDKAASCVADTVEYLFAQYPSTARRAGRHDLDGYLPRAFTRSASDLDRLRTVAERHLRALPDGADPELRADLDSAVRITHGESFRVTELGQDCLTPLEALDAADLSSYLRPYAPLAERLEALDLHLSRLPGFLAEVGRALPARLGAGERLRGVEQAQAQAMNIPAIVGQMAPADDSSVTASRRADAVAAARAACADFGRVVAAAKPASGLLGPERLAESLRITEGIDTAPAELLEEARAEVAALESALDATAAALGADSRDEACELMSQQVSPGSVTELMTGVIERLREFWLRTGVVSMDTTVPVQVRPVSGIRTTATVEFSVSPPLERAGQPHVLYVPEWVPADDGTPSPERRLYLNDPMIEIIAVHEVFAGHYLQAESVARGPSVIRSCFPWLSDSGEGWAHYTEELAVQQGLADGRPFIRLAQLKLALEQTTRLIGFLCVQMKRTTFAEAVAETTRLSGWSQDRAAREILALVVDPGGAMYTLAKLIIRHWREEAGVVAAPELTHFHDRLLRCGNAPLSVVWRYYLDSRDAARPANTEIQ